MQGPAGWEGIGGNLPPVATFRRNPKRGPFRQSGQREKTAPSTRGMEPPIFVERLDVVASVIWGSQGSPGAMRGGERPQERNVRG